MPKKSAFPNSTFATQDEYFDIVDKYHLTGLAAYRKMAELKKQTLLLLPDIRPPRKQKDLKYKIKMKEKYGKTAI